MQQVWVYFNATLARPAANTCLVDYNLATNQVILLNDAASAWMPATPGAAQTLQNSQCSLNVAATSVVLSGNNLTLNLAMTFATAYAGVQNVYLYAGDVSGSNSGWQQLGAWTVPSGAGVPAANSVTPSTGSGASQTFTLQYSDYSRVFKIEDNPGLGSGTAGQFTITKFNGENDFCPYRSASK